MMFNIIESPIMPSIIEGDFEFPREWELYCQGYNGVKIRVSKYPIGLLKEEDVASVVAKKLSYLRCERKILIIVNEFGEFRYEIDEENFRFILFLTLEK